MCASRRLLLNGLAGRDNGLGWLAEAAESLGYRKYTAAAGLPKSFNYRQIKESFVHPQTTADAEHPVAVGTFAPWYLSSALLHEWLNAPPSGEYWQGHLLWGSEAARLLAELDYRHVVILRDPRAVIADLLRENEKLPDFLRADFVHWPAAERLECLENGGHLPQAGVTLVPFNRFYPRMSAWRQDPNTLVMNLEQAGNPAVLDTLLDYLGGAQDRRAPLPPADGDWRRGLDAGMIGRIEDYCLSLTD